MRVRKMVGVMTLAALMLLLALPAYAHSFSGSGDCGGWTLTLDGLWGATEIKVDGVSYGTQLVIVIPDASDSTARTFTVRWVKPGNTPDTVITKRVTRVLNCTPDTTIPDTTVPDTTIPEDTTTTIPEDTTSTTEPPTTSTTSTIPEDTTTTVPDDGPTTTTVPEDEPTTTTIPDTTTPTTTPTTVPSTLPHTGVGTTSGVIAGVAALALGGLVLLTTRPRVEEDV